MKTAQRILFLLLAVLIGAYAGWQWYMHMYPDLSVAMYENCNPDDYDAWISYHYSAQTLEMSFRMPLAGDWTLDFGDGETIRRKAFAPLLTREFHTYNVPGIYHPSLTIIDHQKHCLLRFSTYTVEIK